MAAAGSLLTAAVSALICIRVNDHAKFRTEKGQTPNSCVVITISAVTGYKWETLLCFSEWTQKVGGFARTTRLPLGL